MDGGAVFKKSKNASFWPVHFFINEFKLKYRFKRNKILCAGFHYGGTPDMAVFLRPFIEEINDINQKGGINLKMADNTVRRFLVIPLFCTLDTVAKCHLLNMTQFNGFFGCPYCENEGLSAGGMVRFTDTTAAPIRVDAEFRRCMISAENSKEPVKGAKGLSVLQAIQHAHFDIVWQVVIDIMHAGDLGVTKKCSDMWLSASTKSRYAFIIKCKVGRLQTNHFESFFRLFTKSLNYNFSCFIGNQIPRLDRKASMIKLPKMFKRNIRSLECRKFMHANEFRAFRYTSPFLLNDVLYER